MIGAVALGLPRVAYPALESEPAIAPRELAAFAAACLLISDAELIDSVVFNRRRCEQLIDELWARGIVASESETEAAALGLLVELGAVAR